MGGHFDGYRNKACLLFVIVVLIRRTNIHQWAGCHVILAVWDIQIVLETMYLPPAPH